MTTISISVRRTFRGTLVMVSLVRLLIGYSIKYPGGLGVYNQGKCPTKISFVIFKILIVGFILSEEDKTTV